MDVQAQSFRGFKIVGRGITQAAADSARAEVEALLETHGVTAADIDNLMHRFRILGESGVDVGQLTSADLRRYNIDPSHVRANSHITEVFRTVRKLGAIHPGSVIAFKPDQIHA